ncbi:hypothetical protein LX36DRAFT_443639 [Colletotrichum falcatum]|nr:hypothetical protein LX36DRAFT_443639 [Colletotrichum falcatum]
MLRILARRRRRRPGLSAALSQSWEKLDSLAASVRLRIRVTAGPGSTVCLPSCLPALSQDRGTNNKALPRRAAQVHYKHTALSRRDEEEEGGGERFVSHASGITTSKPCAVPLRPLNPLQLTPTPPERHRNTPLASATHAFARLIRCPSLRPVPFITACRWLKPTMSRAAPFRAHGFSHQKHRRLYLQQVKPPTAQRFLARPRWTPTVMAPAGR